MMFLRLLICLPSFFLFLLMNPYPLKASELELKLTPSSKDEFFLIDSVLDSRGVSINKQGNVNQNIFDHNLSLINFENLTSDSNIAPKNITLINESHLGTKSALFYNKESAIKIQYRGDFESGFSIEFWVKPFSTELGRIFSSQYLSVNEPHKSLDIAFEKGHIVFRFENLFTSYRNNSIYHDIKIQSTSIIPTNQWGAHKLTYNPANGKLNYYYNGVLNSQEWATDTQTSNNALLYFEIPKESQFIIGKGFRGLMDQFSISSQALEQNAGVIHEKSYIVSRVFDLKKVASISSFFSDTLLPKDTGIKIEYRDDLLPFNPATPESILPWKEYDQTSLKPSPIKARYVQVKLTLFRDPTNYQSPLIRSIGFRYQYLEVPINPTQLNAISTKGDLIISFKEGVTLNIAAYKIYIGTKRDQYFGEPDISLESPILVPLSSFTKNPSTNRLSYKISGLTRDKLYFIRISAVSHEGVEGDPTEELSARIRML